VAVADLFIYLFRPNSTHTGRHKNSRLIIYYDNLTTTLGKMNVAICNNNDDDDNTQVSL